MAVENLEEFSSWWRGSEGGQGWWPVWPPVQLLECTELANQPLSWACSTYSACTNLACAVCLLSTQAGHVPSLSLHLHLVYAVHIQSEKKLNLSKNSACTNLAYIFSVFLLLYICEYVKNTILNNIVQWNIIFRIVLKQSSVFMSHILLHCWQFWCFRSQN